MRRLIAALAIATVVAVVIAVTPFGAKAEVFNEPGGFTAGAASGEVLFPRAFFDVLVFNDDAAESIHVRLFWCFDPATGLPEVVADATTSSLEITAGTNRSFKYNPGESGSRNLPGYCALTHIRGGSSDVAGRLEGK